MDGSTSKFFPIHFSDIFYIRRMPVIRNVRGRACLSYVMCVDVLSSVMSFQPGKRS